MTTTSKGANFEREIKQVLEAAGYSVMRGAGSKGEFFDVKVDLIATKHTAYNEFTAYLTIVGIQCKVKGK